MWCHSEAECLKVFWAKKQNKYNDWEAIIWKNESWREDVRVAGAKRVLTSDWLRE